MEYRLNNLVVEPCPMGDKSRVSDRETDVSLGRNIVYMIDRLVNKRASKNPNTEKCTRVYMCIDLVRVYQ